MIGNIKYDAKAHARYIFSISNALFDQFNKLTYILDGKSLLNGLLFQRLQLFVSFRQFRVRCHKTHPNRTVHFMTKENMEGKSFVDFIIGNAPSPGNCHNIFQRFDDDDSRIMKECPVLGSPKEKTKRLYDHVVFIFNKHHINIRDYPRLECDDFSAVRPFSPFGSWEYFVR